VIRGSRPARPIHPTLAEQGSFWCQPRQSGKGAQVIVMTNDKGAQLELSGKQVGLQVNADLSGIAITVK